MMLTGVRRRRLTRSPGIERTVRARPVNVRKIAQYMGWLRMW